MSNAEKIAAIEETACEVNGFVRSDYSGRGMFGRTCYGICCHCWLTCVEALAARGLRGSQVDQMGKGYIVYWYEEGMPPARAAKLAMRDSDEY